MSGKTTSELEEGKLKRDKISEPEFVPFHISIFEQSLSEHGCYKIHPIKEKDDILWIINKTRYLREYPLFTGSLYECLKYVAKNLYYE